VNQELRKEVQAMINETLVSALDEKSIVVQTLARKIITQTFRELKESLESLGDLDHYNFQSIEAQCTAHAARDIADRIGWMIEN
jgi:hypothetical protein